MLKIVAILLVVLGAGLLGYAALRPDSFRVQRSATIKAPPEKIAVLIQDFRRWGAWSPYEKLDPAMSRTYGGPGQGVGATYEWSGSGKAGAGRMEIIEASLARTAIRLDFTKPFATSNLAEFTLVPRGETTEVTWAMDGPSPYIAKLLGVFVSMDRIIGDDFAAGLANLKAAAEG